MTDEPCRHDSCSGDEGPAGDLGSRHVVRWKCDGCGAIVYSDAALAEVRREHAELRKLVDQQLGECVGCNYNDGPDEYCPRHGRPYNDVLDVTERIITKERADLAAARVEVTQLQARIDRAEKLAREWIASGWTSAYETAPDLAGLVLAALAEPFGSTPPAERSSGKTVVVCRWCCSPNLDSAEHGASVSDGKGGGDLACLWPCRHEVQRGDTVCQTCFPNDEPFAALAEPLGSTPTRSEGCPCGDTSEHGPHE